MLNKEFSKGKKGFASCASKVSLFNLFSDYMDLLFVSDRDTFCHTPFNKTPSFLSNQFPNIGKNEDIFEKDLEEIFFLIFSVWLILFYYIC